MLRVLSPQGIHREIVEYPASRRPLVAPKPTVRCITEMGNILTPWGEPTHIAVRQAQEHRNLLRDKIVTLAFDMFSRSILVSSNPLLGAETSSHCEPQQHSPPPTATHRPCVVANSRESLRTIPILPPCTYVCTYAMLGPTYIRTYTNNKF